VNQNPVALVTGAARGIGRGIAVELARNGYDIAGIDIAFKPDKQEPGQLEVQEQIRGMNSHFLPVTEDVGSLAEHEQIIKIVFEHYGRIDLLVNNVGVAPKLRKDVLETTPESYDRLMSINTRGPFFLTQRVANIMIEQKKVLEEAKPTIIFISSISAVVSSPARAEYCISKAALSMAATVFADRLSEYGINVYEIRPGIIMTDMTEPVKDKYDKLIREGLVPQKRWGYPEDIGNAVAALAKGSFGYSTGLVLELSGGMNIRHL